MEDKIIAILQIAVDNLQSNPDNYESKLQWANYACFAYCLTGKDYFINKRSDPWSVKVQEHHER